MVVSLFLLIEFIVFGMIYSKYFRGINSEILSMQEYAYVLFSFWSHYLILFAIISLSIYFLGKISKKQIVTLSISAILSTLILLVLYVDTKVFSLLGLHLSRFVFEALIQDDALNQIGLSPKDMVLSNWILLIYLLPAIYIKPLSKIKVFSLGINKKRIALLLVSFVSLFIVDKLFYSFYYFKGNPVVFELRDAAPLYVTPHSFYIRKSFAYVLGESSRVNFTQPLKERKKSSISYPGQDVANKVRLKKNYNVILVVAESLRSHDITIKSAPNLFRLQKESIKLNEHYTSGNCTHFGLFSLFYGLDPYYFHDFRVSQAPPFAINVFKANDYAVHASVSRTMKWYDLEKFLLGKDFNMYLPDEGNNFERDKLVTNHALQVASENKKLNKPYINFVYYYATHADYEHPEEHSVYLPEIKGRVDFSSESLLKKENQIKLINRYKNAIHFVDSELGRMVDGLKELGVWDNTILVFTGDHGEEFFEKGRFGHNSALNIYQTKVPMLIHIPGMENINIDKLTSHTDIMQTLLGVLSEAPLDDSYFQGNNFLSDDIKPIYIGKAHYQRPRSYLILDGDKKIALNLENKELEVTLTKGFDNTDGAASNEINQYIFDLLMRHRQL